jgi:hypothetical protein
MYSRKITAKDPYPPILKLIVMTEDQQQHDQHPKLGSGISTLPSLVPGLQGTEASALQLKIKNSIW